MYHHLCEVSVLHGLLTDQGKSKLGHKAGKCSVLINGDTQPSDQRISLCYDKRKPFFHTSYSV